ncbi:unnamed protein product [Durusdinium trenchii]|uniref:Uncharacterized protein n=2 Tax=Durusdinium trenchii TaxID=1381693 RepID=A0ABP0JUV1_9DINO
MPGRSACGGRAAYGVVLLLVGLPSATLQESCDATALLQYDSHGVRLRRSRASSLTAELAGELSDGRLDYLAAHGAPYTAQEVGCIAANMANNMFPNGTIVAAPSKVSSNHSNDYYYMWQRDAAMTMGTLLRSLTTAPNQVFASVMRNQSSAIRRQLVNYVELLPRLWDQWDPNTLCPPWYEDKPGWCAKMGEPKYFVNGSVYNKPWGRPQNDGPALAGVFLAELANAILDAGDEIPGHAEELQTRLLSGGGTTGILYDALNFVNTWYNEGSTEPWEEIYGQAFFLAEVQRLALVTGVRYARRKGLNASAVWPKSGYSNWVYSEKNLRKVSKSFVSQEYEYVQAMTGRQQGLAGPKCINSEPLLLKTGNNWPEGLLAPCELDVQTLIAANYLAGAPDAAPEDRVLPPHDYRLVNTARLLVKSMAPYYEVNAVDRSNGFVGLLIGRYPGDTYCGYGDCPKNDFGNPWFITTHALAEQLYFLAFAWCKDQLNLQDAKAVSHLWEELSHGKVTGWNTIQMGDSVMKNAKEHVIMPGVHMSEEIKKSGPDAGQQAGVPDLTWSYSSALSALLARHQAIRACRKD